MTKNFLLVVALLSLTLAVGCATGGNGIVPPPITMDVTITGPYSNINSDAIYPTQSVTLTAAPSSGPTVPVTWTLSGAGTLTPVTPATNPPTATYVAPGAAASGISVTATSTTDATLNGNLGITVVPVSVVVTPLTVSVGQDLVQRFTAVAIPDDAPQQFTWTCTPGAACAGFSGPSNSDVAVYTAPSSAQSGVQITATSTVAQNPLGTAASKVSVVPSLLTPGTYAFQFSGSNDSGNSIAMAGSVTAGANGAITSGVEDVAIDGVYNQYTTVTGSYVPSANNGNDISNNLGKLTLSASGGPSYTFTAVLTSSGIVRMIDNAGTGSGVMQPLSTGTHFNTQGQTFAFGFTGVDSNGKRVGYAGLLPMTPNGNGTAGTITDGLLDSNDNGSPTTVCATPPCTVTGNYSLQANVSWQMTLNVGTTVLDFDFYVSAGTTQTKTGPGALALYAISTDPIKTNPAVSGSMVYQVPMTSGYNNAAFSGTSVSNLTGTNANVALTVGITDGTSSGTGGTGGFTGTFDQNDNGTIISVPPSAAFSYTYVATSSNTGRYIFQMLGNPTAKTVVPPIPFVLYASGANRGFLLDQSSSAVMTGTMDPQPSLKNFGYGGSELPGIYAAATVSNSDSSVAPVVQNLLLTSTGFTPAGTPTYLATGIQNPGNVSLTNGTYTINNNATGAGTGTITYTSPGVTYVIYAIDATAIAGSPNNVITDFMMMGTCTPQAPATTCSSGPASSIMFAQQ
ncbi:MAG: hypothetical protein ACLP0H_02960 [Terriglobales bacterium]